MNNIPFCSSFILCCFAVLYSACNPSAVSPEDMQAYVQDPGHGLVKEKTVNHITLRVQHRPSALLVAQELKNKPYSASLSDSLEKKYNRYAYFILTLSAGGEEVLQPHDRQRFSNQLQTLAFKMDRYVYMQTATGDTIPVADFIYPRLFGTGGGTKILFAFERERIKGSQAVDFVIKEMGWGMGMNRFRFDTDDLEAIPPVDYQQLKIEKT